MTQTNSENSVTFSLQELARIEEERVREEETKRARAREISARERQEAEARKRAEEEARIAATEKAREARAREEAAEKVVREARARAEIDVARMQAEAKARLDADNAMRAHEIAVLRVRAETGRRRWIYGLGVAFALAVLGGGLATYESSQRVAALEKDAEHLRESQLSLSREHERARATELGALDLRMAALVARPLAKEAAEARKTAEAARGALDPKAIEHDRLRAYADALDALQSKIEAAEKLESLERRRESLAGWAVALRKAEDTRVADAAGHAKSSGAEDSALRSYENALDRWQRDLGQSSPQGATGTGGTKNDTRPKCDPNVGDPMCDPSGHRIL